MKTIILFLSLFFVGISFAQTKQEVDPRLIVNKGEEIYQILEYRKDYYKFLLWELDNAYEIVNVSDISNQNLIPVSNIVDKNGNAFNVAELDTPESFNFIKYNFVRQKEQDVYYDLGDGRALKFTALKVMWQQFDATGLNTKL
ncbi:MAG: hypothetical protein ACWA41_11605 [Putridiphycobacter sp.]